MNQNFCLHPIGQGLFYSARISIDAGGVPYQFCFVFDCGSINRNTLSLDVAKFRKEGLAYKNEIDLLVISHFDMDHVSGIKALVEGKKIRRLVMPFLGFTERLVLALRIVEYYDSPRSQDMEIIDLILDPLKSLAENLDGDSTVYLVDASPRDPDLPRKNIAEDFNEFNEFIEWPTFDFDGRDRQAVFSDIFFGEINSRARVFKVFDDSAGKISSKVYELMDFIFYKKNLGNKDKLFFDEVELLFRAQYAASGDIKAGIEALHSAEPVKRLFAKAAENVGLDYARVKNLNTTALCMLHRTLPKDPLDRGHCSSYTYFRPIIRKSAHEDWTDVYAWYCFGNNYGHDYFANTLLSSDTFLLERADLDDFLKHYNQYLERIILAQIPHHGSAHSADQSFFAEIKNRSSITAFFCNYSFNSLKHPALPIKLLIADLEEGYYFPIHQSHGQMICCDVYYSTP